jgi:hypothetical protein
MPATRRVLCAVDAPAGIGEPTVRHHLEELTAAVLRDAPGAETASLQAYPAGCGRGILDR